MTNQPYTPDLSVLPSELDPQLLPHHVAVIMDGNGRWATQQGLPRIAGHRQGARRVKELLKCCKDWRISTLTVYAFSTENWKRPTQEVDFLMALFERLLRKELAEMHREGVRVVFLGDLLSLPNTLRTVMEESMSITRDNQAVQFNVAVNYGARDELLRVCKMLSAQVQQGDRTPDSITEADVESLLYTIGSPDPDLLIRTSGEQRLSNFLLWQLAYAELYFTPKLWPEFDRTEFFHALLNYQQRDRRFGQVTAARSA
ncbi:MAG: isoprenyl transferase [Cyanobacteria bacterium P01_E01_bin.6]